MRKEIYFGYNHMEVQRLVALPPRRCLLYGDTIPKWTPDVLCGAHPVFLSHLPHLYVLYSTLLDAAALGQYFARPNPP